MRGYFNPPSTTESARASPREKFRIFKKVLTQIRVSRQKGSADDVCTCTRDVKKQINSPVNAHVLRSALILLSLVTFNREIFCQTPTPSPTATAECPRPTPGACVSYEAESPICPPNPEVGERCNILTGSAFVL